MKKLLRVSVLLLCSFLIASAFGCKKAPKQPEPVEVVEVEPVKKVNPNIAIVNNADLVVDVRRPDEFAQGHLNGAVNIPHNDIESHLGEISEYQNKTVALYCRSGRRASLARTQLMANGFTNVINAGAYYDLLVAEQVPAEDNAELNQPQE